MANPTEFGSSGLLHVPTADTLDSANFCFGLWGNCSNRADAGSVVIVPATLTLGIGTFWEIYGTYPNVSLNSDTQKSDRGTADIGMKLRVIGTRSSKFKLAVDSHMSRYIDNDPKYNGKNDKGARVIASFRNDLFGLHLSGGFMSNADSRELERANSGRSKKEYPLGAGIDFIPSTRTKLTLELTATDVKRTAPYEASAGFQYYLTPHLTFNLSTGVGLTSSAPDWRVLAGLSTCQGVGAYIKPVPVVTRKDGKGLKADVIKPTKVVALSPLLIRAPVVTTPVSKFEIPVDADGDEILIRPYGNVVIAQQTAAKSVNIPKSVYPDQIQSEAASIVPVAPTVADTATEYSLTRVSGITPLYGVTVTGQVTPVEKLSKPVAAYRKFRLPDTLFEFDNAEMIPEVQKSVSELAEFIRKDSKWVFLRIDGHTDAVGSVKYNMELSLKRAVTVANYLITREGIDPARIFVRGMGKSAPVADNTTDVGRKLNRRFEIVFLVHKEEKVK
ncbi:MAG: OmpA family protein [Geobacteraceae bacterium]|nr:OmpA family protein [Geobacteraceae bacterium]